MNKTLHSYNPDTFDMFNDVTRNMNNFAKSIFLNEFGFETNKNKLLLKAVEQGYVESTKALLELLDNLTFFQNTKEYKLVFRHDVEVEEELSEIEQTPLEKNSAENSENMKKDNIKALKDLYKIIYDEASTDEMVDGAISDLIGGSYANNQVHEAGFPVQIVRLHADFWTKKYHNTFDNGTII